MAETTQPDTDPKAEAAEATRAAQVEAAMKADGVPTHIVVQQDYFGFEELHTTPLPDGVSWVQHQSLNEGARKKYLNSTNRDVRISKVTQDAHIRMAPGDERHALLTSAIVGWDLIEGDAKVPFSDRNLARFLDKAPPKVIDVIEKAVRLANPWLLAEVTGDDIRKEIEDLTDLLAKKEAEEAGNASS